jgi:hypothetical protein
MVAAVDIVGMVIMAVVIFGILVPFFMIAEHVYLTKYPPQCQYCGKKPVVSPTANRELPEAKYCEDHILEKDRK